MKKLFTIALAVMTVATLVSCGASPQARQGFTKAVQNANDAMTTVDGTTTAGYVYATAEVATTAQLTAIGVNLAGLIDPTWASKPISSFSMAVIIDATNTKALLAIALEFEGDDQPYGINLPSTGTITNKNGLMQINFTDGGLPIALTSTPGTLAGSTTILMNIRDAAMTVQFATNTPFTLIQTPTTVATK
jgi:hypothetical protein